MKRDELRQRVFASSQDNNEVWDILIIGGGATGVGIAVDAAARGYRTLLVEQHDFGKGTSSRSTKLVHGGVRYLRQGNISLVKEALRERGLMRQNAPHLVHDLAFVVPSYSWYEKYFYGIGLKVYDWLAGKLRFGRTKFLSKNDVVARVSTIKQENLRGGVLYSDGQFDDARLLINLVTTAVEQGATLLNYTRVVSLLKNNQSEVHGVEVEDIETGERKSVRARVVVNATGPFCDAVRKLADDHAENLVAPSQGVHLVFDRSFLPGETAIMIPRTPDGRVLFAIPWHGHTLVGTTDVAIREIPLEPIPTEQEIDFILETCGRYLAKPPTHADILSTFAGIRPLVQARGKKNTSALSRDHTIHIDDSKLITITGGKWTTYRNMAEDCVNQAAKLGGLEARPCTTRELKIHGYSTATNAANPLAVYGADATAIEALLRENAAWKEQLHSDLPYVAAEVIWAVRLEMARTVEDVLARRTRALFLNANAASAMAERVAELLAGELERDETWRHNQVAEFRAVARGYVA